MSRFHREDRERLDDVIRGGRKGDKTRFEEEKTEPKPKRKKRYRPPPKRRTRYYASKDGERESIRKRHDKDVMDHHRHILWEEILKHREERHKKLEKEWDRRSRRTGPRAIARARMMRKG